MDPLARETRKTSGVWIARLVENAQTLCLPAPFWTAALVARLREDAGARGGTDVAAIGRAVATVRLTGDRQKNPRSPP